ncbi:SHOCT domain-containing protein [Streptomyces griseosporeus]|uniref:SHOCT domain-containing protein n=1 Tax=Streptomyces griseosporeus TaxID=1910 RepID=UPI0036BD32F7
MFWYDHDPGGWGWFTMSVGMILFWGVLITFGVLLWRALSRPDGSGAMSAPAPRRPTPEQLLAERFARGELDENAYRRGLTVLRGHGDDPGPDGR